MRVGDIEIEKRREIQESENLAQEISGSNEGTREEKEIFKKIGR